MSIDICMKTHELLKKLFDRSGYKSQEALAQAMGFANASSINRYFKDDGRKGKYLPLELTIKFSEVFVGKGEPPITKEDVLLLAGPYTTDIVQPRPASVPSLTPRQEVSRFIKDFVDCFELLSDEAKHLVPAFVLPAIGLTPKTQLVIQMNTEDNTNKTA